MAKQKQTAPAAPFNASAELRAIWQELGPEAKNKDVVEYFKERNPGKTVQAAQASNAKAKVFPGSVGSRKSGKGSRDMYDVGPITVKELQAVKELGGAKELQKMLTVLETVETSFGTIARMKEAVEAWQTLTGDE